MTLINLQVRRDSVFFLTDTAAIDKKGRLQQHRQKIGYHPHLNAAVAVTGNVGQSRDINTVMAHYSSQAEMLENITRHVKHTRIWHPFSRFFHVLIGLIDDEGRGRAFAVSTAKGEEIKPYTLHPVDDWIIQPAIEDERFADALTSAWLKIPYDYRSLVQYQRTHPVASAPSAGFIVGGNIILSRLSKNGMETSVVERYPDEIGKPLDGRNVTAPV
ncbi:hypothetical protein ACQKGC_08305 [Allorhizobium pseudoryzae]|uniref:hypothetical protein n=1 Tax=Allorhizobium pseudoryzae TaxID=379684 RepID=UPI003D064F8C